jgi:3',5'-cyclic AMP phosphodiesterase CpdA
VRDQVRADRQPMSRLLLAALFVACAARAAPGYTVYAAGDIAYCTYPDAKYSHAADTAAVVALGLKQDPQAAVLTLGDHTYPNGRAAEFASCYGPTWGQFRDRTYPAPGNHEYATRGATPYFDYFGARADAVDVRRGYYSFDLGAWHLVSLNSNVHGPDMAAQLAWLRADLASHPARCTLAYWHHPLYSSGGHGNVATMHDAWDILYQAGAEIVLSGHDHDYERFAPQDADFHLDTERGIRQFVVGTGGAYATPFLWRRANSQFRENNRFGVLRLRLLDDGYEWQYMPVADSIDAGPGPDHGSEKCH